MDVFIRLPLALTLGKLAYHKSSFPFFFPLHVVILVYDLFVLLYGFVCYCTPNCNNFVIEKSKKQKAK